MTGTSEGKIGYLLNEMIQEKIDETDFTDIVDSVLSDNLGDAVDKAIREQDIETMVAEEVQNKAPQYIKEAVEQYINTPAFETKLDGMVRKSMIRVLGQATIQSDVSKLRLLRRVLGGLFYCFASVRFSFWY